ncbi:hypothetical protein BDP55DRAFT_17463 [Colletotrichum godetiae]|uniref:Uncharacterized protein n=1 Tax=Colletotrichum godetiae TaxID=1209918 RepID=A0AAJ0B1F0_9PEZI|nr:uncharacterized protein BDP55DRAFT_17463 [Colletotrichum godetiae]KAK1701317.1 hypothetical protein BDP55DRAFT_17463 [Colletotrichum godetiae]
MMTRPLILISSSSHLSPTESVSRYLNIPRNHLNLCQRLQNVENLGSCNCRHPTIQSSQNIDFTYTRARREAQQIKSHQGDGPRLPKSNWHHHHFHPITTNLRLPRFRLMVASTPPARPLATNDWQQEVGFHPMSKYGTTTYMYGAPFKNAGSPSSSQINSTWVVSDATIIASHSLWMGVDHRTGFRDTLLLQPFEMPCCEDWQCRRGTRCIRRTALFQSRYCQRGKTLDLTARRLQGNLPRDCRFYR